ncbi:glycosyltransferase family 4 protein [Flammeovirga pacifica]|uniref:Glycosyltransferase WbuB n=1 Tax=Flammeovirga pacifica TaxID=915059 RepID=A0A1S1YW51_FLAPC|nr:glycosyltransferase family 4 protein [Flammeovirga pacifica]OHX65251.1 hypothetical protein NH26_02220 [Flammeovirga pacifica]
MTLYTENIQEKLHKQLNKTSKKIGVVTHCYPPDFGAAPHQFEYLATTFAKKGHNVTVFTSHPYYPKGNVSIKDLFTWKNSYQENNVSVIRHWLLPSQKNNMVFRLISMSSMLISMLSSLPIIKKKGIEVLLIQTPPISLPIFGLIAKKLYGIQLILNVSDLWPQAMVDINGLSKKSLTYRLLHRLEKYYYKKADLLITQSEESQKYIKQLGFGSPEIYRIGAATSVFQQKKDWIKKDQFRIVYMGVLGVAHGISKLIDEVDFDQLGIELHIYGDGVDAQNIRNIIQKKQLQNVNLYTSIPYQEVPDVLQQYDLALISQINYVKGTLPAKLYESMSVGLPIIYHGEGEGAEIVRQFNCGWVSSPSDYNQLTQHLKLICQTTEEVLKEKGQNARITCVEHFDLEKQFDHLNHLVSSLTVNQD